MRLLVVRFVVALFLANGDETFLVLLTTPCFAPDLRAACLATPVLTAVVFLPACLPVLLLLVFGRFDLSDLEPSDLEEPG